MAALLLDTAEYGRLAIAMTALVFVRAVTALGLYGEISIAFHNRTDGKRVALEITRWHARLFLPLSALAVVLGAVAPGVVGVSLAAASIGMSSAVALVQQSLFRSSGWTLGYAVAALGSTAFAHPIGLLAAAASPSAKSYVIGMAVGSLAASAFLMHRAGLSPLKRPDRAAALRCRPLVLTAIATAGLAMLDRPVVAGFLGEQVAGRYYLTYLLSGACVPLIGGFANAWLPQVLAQPPERRARALTESSRRNALAFGLIAMAAAAATPVIIRVMAPQGFEYGALAATAALVAAATPFFVLYNASTIALVGLENTTPIMVSTLAGALLGLAINLASLPTIGIVGAGIATVAGYALTSTMSMRAAGLRWDRGLAGTVAGVTAGAAMFAVIPDRGAAATGLRLTCAVIGAGFGTVYILRKEGDLAR